MSGRESGPNHDELEGVDDLSEDSEQLKAFRDRLAGLVKPKAETPKKVEGSKKPDSKIMKQDWPPKSKSE